MSQYTAAPGKSKHRKYQPLLDVRGVMVAAYWPETRTLLKLVRAGHRLTNPPAWCLDVHALAAAKQLGAEWIEVRDKSTGLSYRAPIGTFESHGFCLDRGAGPQVGLPLGYWSIGGKAPVLGPPDASQLCLWGAA